MQFPALLILILIWFFVGLPLKKLNEASKKNASAKARPAVKPAEKTEPVREEHTAPTVLQPTVSVTAHDDSIYLGSLGAVTGEGYDPCHEEQLSSLSAAETYQPAPQPASPGLQLSWTGKDVVRGIVMSEILKRK